MKTMNEFEAMMAVSVVLMFSGILIFQAAMRTIKNKRKIMLIATATILTVVGSVGTEFYRQLQTGTIQLEILLQVSVIWFCFCMTAWLIILYRHISKKAEERIMCSVIKKQKKQSSTRNNKIIPFRKGD